MEVSLFYQFNPSTLCERVKTERRNLKGIRVTEEPEVRDDGISKR